MKGTFDAESQVAIGESREAFGDFVDRAYPVGHIRCELHNLQDASVIANDGIVGGLDPDDLAAFANAFELRSDGFPAASFDQNVL